MLVLSRKEGERVMIGNNIAVSVVEVRGGRVKLGFECPNAIPVNREEIYRRLEVDKSPSLSTSLNAHTSL